MTVPYSGRMNDPAAAALKPLREIHIALDRACDALRGGRPVHFDVEGMRGQVDQVLALLLERHPAALVKAMGVQAGVLAGQSYRLLNGETGVVDPAGIMQGLLALRGALGLLPEIDATGRNKAA